jgi:hypothetical protein
MTLCHRTKTTGHLSLRGEKSLSMNWRHNVSASLRRRSGSGKHYFVCFVQNGGRLAVDANGEPAGWTNFEIKMHKSVGGRLYLFYAYMNEYILVFIYSVI